MHNVTIYTTPTCGFCKMAKAFFKEHNIAYAEKDVSLDEQARNEMLAKSNQFGVPPKDGIPSIDNPKFVSVTEASAFLNDREPGIAFAQGTTHRFYPFQILVWHEIVNDTIKGRRVLVTYCPLCMSAIVFDPVVQGERVEFGTSGKLWNSNLVTYDRKTDSLWSQISGEAIVDEMTGTKLTVLASDRMLFGEWKQAHPDGEVLSRDTGAERFYGQDPYGDYYTSSEMFFPVNKDDDRMQKKDFVLGIVIDGKAKAYWTEAIKQKGEIEDTFAGKTIVARYERDIDTVRVFEKKQDGTLAALIVSTAVTKQSGSSSSRSLSSSAVTRCLAAGSKIRVLKTPRMPFSNRFRTTLAASYVPDRTSHITKQNSQRQKTAMWSSSFTPTGARPARRLTAIWKRAPARFPRISVCSRSIMIRRRSSRKSTALRARAPLSRWMRTAMS